MTSIPGATLGAADSATTSTPAAIGGAVGGVITSPVACLKPFAPRIRPEPFLKPPSPPAVPTSRPVARGASVASRGAVGCCITSAPDAACGAVGNATISTPGAARGVVRARYQSGLGVAATAAAAWRRAGSGGPALFAGDCTRPRAFGVTLPGGLRLPEDARLADRLRQGGRSFSPPSSQGHSPPPSSPTIALALASAATGLPGSTQTGFGRVEAAEDVADPSGVAHKFPDSPHRFACWLWASARGVGRATFALVIPEEDDACVNRRGVDELRLLGNVRLPNASIGSDTTPDNAGGWRDAACGVLRCSPADDTLVSAGRGD
mmetsp:Transcript_127585/g.291627  ORF Transcript_127585/g.291627 Transcript_127585/m.291627 type:complete len:321 (-) Transcript_127585:1097-2059(-)